MDAWKIMENPSIFMDDDWGSTAHLVGKLRKYYTNKRSVYGILA